MNDKEKDNHVSFFQGAKLKKREANRVGLGLILGFAGVLVSIFAIGADNKTAAYIIGGVFTLIGYFGLGKIIFKE